MSKKRSSLNPAWKEWCNRNMRGQTLRWGGAHWVVITHIKRGVWKLGRLSGSWNYGDYITMPLDREGRPDLIGSVTKATDAERADAPHRSAAQKK